MLLVFEKKCWKIYVFYLFLMKYDIYKNKLYFIEYG